MWVIKLSCGLSRSTRLMAVVIISDSDASIDAFISSGDENLPVPSKRRELNFLFEIVNDSVLEVCVFIVIEYYDTAVCDLMQITLIGSRYIKLNLEI